MLTTARYEVERRRIIQLGCGGVLLVVAVLLVGLLIAPRFVSFELDDAEVAGYEARGSAPFEHLQWSHGDRSMHAVAVGGEEDPTVILVHGSPGSWHAFIEYLVTPALTNQARLITVDRPGFGCSSPGRFEGTLAGQAAALADLLPDDGAILVGHSYGGPVIARLAIDYPGKVRGLIMVAASVDPALEKLYWIQNPANLLLFSWAVPPDLRVCNSEILPLRKELEELMPLWSKITAPVTIIQGGQDRLVPAANADFLERMLVNAPVTVHRFSEANHFLLWTQPEIVVRALLDSLQTAE